jgi:hypothetical protein
MKERMKRRRKKGGRGEIKYSTYKKNKFNIQLKKKNLGR